MSSTKTQTQLSDRLEERPKSTKSKKAPIKDGKPKVRPVQRQDQGLLALTQPNYYGVLVTLNADDDFEEYVKIRA